MMKQSWKELKPFFLLWSTQSLSQLGSAMTSFALTLWLYQETGSALQTALLSVCSYAPYVCVSIFAGALSDRWDKKRVMLACDTFAACCTVAVLALLRGGLLAPWQLYALNALNGLMGSIQQPAGDVAMTLLIPPERYQQTSGLRSFSNALVTILNPVLATALYTLAGMESVILFDLAAFAAAFCTLLFGIRLPELPRREERESVLSSVRAGLAYLREHGLILALMLFLAAVNLVASAFDAVLPALILPRANGGETVLGMVTSCAGIATLLGSVLAAALPAPKDRVRVIVLTMLFSLGTENYLLAFARTPFWWCLAQLIGWILVPLMNANLDVILRSTIPVELQGRVYACRNTLQFFTIPIGFLCGGWLVDGVCEPLMEAAVPDGLLTALFGSGKGSGAALTMLMLGVAGTLVCLLFGRILRPYRYTEQGRGGK